MSDNDITESDEDILVRKGTRGPREFDELREQSHDFEEAAVSTSSAEVTSVDQRKVFNDVDAASIAHRPPGFLPHNPWLHEPTSEIPILDWLQTEAPEEERCRDSYRAKSLFEADNNTSATLYDCLGHRMNAPGITHDTRLQHVGDEIIMYNVGRHFNIVGVRDTSVRRFLSTPERVVDITAFCATIDGRYVAVGESHVTHSAATVYRVDSGAKVTSLDHRLLAKTSITALDFSSNGRFLVTVTSAPEHRLYLWHLEEMRVVGVCEDLDATPISHICFNQWASARLATVSNKTFVSWSHTARDMVPDNLLTKTNKCDLFDGDLVKTSNPSFVSTVWFDEEGVVALTDDGYLVAFEDGVLSHCSQLSVTADPSTHLLPEAPSPSSSTHAASCAESFLSLSYTTMSKRFSVLSRPNAYSHMLWVNRGLLVAGPNATIILVDRTYDAHVFVQVCTFSVGGSSERITGMSVSPGETNVVVATDANRMKFASLGDLDNAINTARSRTDKASMSFTLSGSMTGIFGESCIDFGADVAVSMEHCSFHDAPVSAVTMSLQRPLIATADSKGLVRVYNYITHELVVEKRFSDAISCCALHPMGTQIIISESFASGLYALLDDSLLLLSVLNVRGVQEAMFSTNGGRVAFCVGNRVVVTNASTLENVGMLIGHSVTVRSVQWSCHDTQLVTSDVGGSIMAWDAFSLKRCGSESAHRNLLLQSAIGTPAGLVAATGVTKHPRGALAEGEFAIVCGSLVDSQVPPIYLRPGILIPKAVANRKTHTNATCFSSLSSTLFVGCPTGRILLYSWPVLRHSRPYTILDATRSEIIHLTLTPDERFLVAVSPDATMMLFSLLHQRDGKYVTVPPFEYAATESVRLISAEAAAQLTSNVEASVVQERIHYKRLEVDASAREINAGHETSLHQVRTELQSRISALRKEIAAVRSSTKELIEKGRLERQEADEKFQKLTETIESQYNRLAEEAAKQRENLVHQRETFIVGFEGARTDSIRRWESTKGSMEAVRLEREKSLSSELQRLQQHVREQSLLYDAMIDQTVVDGERDVDRLVADHQQAMRETEEAIHKVGQVQSAGEREAERLTKEIANLKTEMDTKESILREVKTKCEQRSSENAHLKTENKHRQENINAAEKLLQQLRKQLTTLENLRFILVHQFEQLQADVEPKEARIRQLERAVSEREGLLQIVHHERGEVQGQLRGTEQNLRSNNTIFKRQMLKHSDNMYAMKSLLSDLAKALDRYAKTPTAFGEHLKQVLSASTRRIPDFHERLAAATTSSSSATEKELDQHIHFLRCQHHAVVKEVARERSQAEGEKIASRQVNSTHMRAIRNLQDERSALADELRTLESQLRETRVTLHRMVEGATDVKSSDDGRTVARPLLPALPVTRKTTKVEKQSPSPTPVLPQVVTAQSSPAENAVIEKRSRSAKEKAIQKAHLQELISQLDFNTVQMRTQQEEIGRLRGCVKDMLALEENSLTRRVGARASAMPTQTARGSMLLTAVLNRRDTAQSTDSALEEVDWSEGQGARPMTPTTLS